MALLLTRSPDAPRPAGPLRAERPGPVYLPELDIVRGAAIIGVVYLHSYFSPWPETPEGQILALNLLHLLAHAAVPIFLFVSGFLLGRSRPVPLREYATKRLHRIMIPAISWMLAAAAYRFIVLDHPAREVWRAFLLFDVSGQFYFVPVLVILTLAGSWLLRRSASLRALHWIVAIAFAVNLVAILYYEQQTVAGDFAVFAYRNPLIWCFCYLFGVYAGRARPNLDWTRRWLLPVLLAMSAVAAVHVWQGERGEGYPVSYFGVTVFLFSSLALVAFPGLIALALASRAWEVLLEPLLEPLRRLGPYTYAIFLVHMPFFLGWLSTEAVQDSSYADDYFQLVHANFAVGLAGTLAFVLLANRLWPRFGRTLLGVEPPRQRRQSLPSPEAGE